jgi:hypothetical protein
MWTFGPSATWFSPPTKVDTCSLHQANRPRVPVVAMPAVAGYTRPSEHPGAVEGASRSCPGARNVSEPAHQRIVECSFCGGLLQTGYE